jgi:hypothetical protein
MKRMTILALVSLLMIGWMPVAEAPNYGSPTWNIVWDGYNVYPDADDPAWTRTTTGTVSRAFQYYNQILNVSMTGAGADSEKYSISFSESDFVIAEGRLNMPITGATAYLRFDGTATDYAWLAITGSSIEIVWDDLPTQSAQTTTHYEENILAANHTYTIAVYVDSGRTHVQSYYDGNLMAADYTDHTMSFTDFYFMCTDGAGSHYCEWDYVALHTVDLTGKLQGLEDEIDELRRDLEELRRTGGADVTKSGNLPFVPVGSRGPILDQDWYELDPYMAYTYTALDNDTGNDMNFNRVWNAGASDYITLSDEWYIQGDYTTIYVNDTKNTTGTGDDTALTDWDAVTEVRTYYNSEYAFNISVETDSAATIKFNRVSHIQVNDEFTWGESSQTGAFRTQQTVENDCSMDWRYVTVYWAFPEQDSDNVDVEVDMASIVVTDEDNNLELDRAEHWTTDAGGVYLAFQYLNASDTRTFSIEFNRRLVEEGDIVRIVTDGDVDFTNTMRTYPFEFTVWHGVLSTKQFNGKIIIKYDFTHEYANRRPGRAIVYVNGDFTSQFVLYEDRMEVYDVSFDAGSSNYVRVLFDWRSAETDMEAWFGGIYIALVCIGAVAFIVGLKWLHANWEKSKKKMELLLGFVAVVLGMFLMLFFGFFIIGG